MMRPHLPRRLLALLSPLLPLLLSACSILPTYQPGNGEAMVTVRALGPGAYSMCKNGVRYQLPFERDSAGHDFLRVPVGERIGLSAFLFYSGYQRNISCSVGLSFIPQAGETYIANEGYRAAQCFIELVRQDDTRETGVVEDKTVDFYYCKAK